MIKLKNHFLNIIISCLGVTQTRTKGGQPLNMILLKNIFEGEKDSIYKFYLNLTLQSKTN